MGRIKPLDLALLFTLGPLWIFSTALSMDRYLSDHPPAYIPIYFDLWEATNEAPAIAGFSPGAAAFSNFDLQPGDRLTRIGGVPVDGQDFVGLLSLIYGGADLNGKVPLRVRRGTSEFDATIQLTYIKQNYFGVLLGLVAGVVLLRGPGTRTSRSFAVGALVLALLRNDAFGSPVRWQILFGYGQMFAASAMAGPLLLRAAMTFPSSAAPKSPWAYGIPWVFALQPLALCSYIFGWPIAPPLGLQLYLVFVVVLYSTTIAIPTVNYWRADSRGRRQLRWIMCGLLVGVFPMAAAATLTLVEPSLYPYATGMFWLGGLLPIFILVALLWDHLFDVDRLITGTMVYGTLAALFLGLVFGIGLPASEWLGAKLGVHPGAFIGIFILSFAIPVPLVIREGQPWLQKYIFREQAATEKKLRTLRFDEDWSEGPGSLLKQVGERLLKIIPLENLAIYAPAGSAYVPVFSSGLLPPPVIAEGSNLHESLLQAGVAIPSRVWKRWGRTNRLRKEDVAALEHLGAEVLVPIAGGDDQLEGFLCLGTKSSGDVFTPTELDLLGGMADRVGAAIQRVGQEVRAQDERSRYEKALGYVPSIVTDDLLRGTEIVPGESEVTVLFIDLDGYTSRSMGQSAQETFNMINTYTKVISEKIRHHGGSVVEFHGDGLMAVFGAPRPIEGKESRAIEAARESVRELREGAIASLSLSAGVGIATGTAFVGNVEAVDRKIWTVLGNPTNLAARLRGLATLYGSSIVVDDPTYTAAPEVAHDFEQKKNVQVKGRNDEIRVWCMPQAA